MGLNHKSDLTMPRKCVVKVVLSKEQREILNELARRLGTSESETMRMSLMDYAKELSVMKEIIHKKAILNDSKFSKSVPVQI
jgi:ribulose bisphosphate carboxylase small subunit